MLTLCVLIWAVPGREAELAAYEDAVLAIIRDHGGSVLQRLRGVPGIDGGDDPTEVHVLQFASQAAFDAYLSDEGRAALAPQRDACVARTQAIRVQPVSFDC